ncbi:hypothetical protein JCM1841_005435 [Sporobolomyces salmonicolor]
MVYTLICHAEVKEAHIQDMVDKLREAAVDVHDPKKFAIVEHFEKVSSHEYHLNEPYWAPWLTKPIEILRFNEL